MKKTETGRAVPGAIDFSELHPSDRLAIERTIMAADRTLLASVRTSLSLIGFGFTIYKILDHFHTIEGVRFIREQTPRNLGIFMLLLGIVPLLLSIHHYKRTVTRLGGTGDIVNPNVITAAAVILLGLVLLAVTVLNLDII